MMFKKKKVSINLMLNIIHRRPLGGDRFQLQRKAMLPNGRITRQVVACPRTYHLKVSMKSHPSHGLSCNIAPVCGCKPPGRRLPLTHPGVPECPIGHAPARHRTRPPGLDGSWRLRDRFFSSPYALVGGVAAWIATGNVALQSPPPPPVARPFGCCKPLFICRLGTAPAPMHRSRRRSAGSAPARQRL
jgi:hypothetical protein